MAVINFPASPLEGDTYAAGSNLWQYDGAQWVIIPYGVPKYGALDGGRASGVGNIVFVDGGTAFSTFGSALSIDAGTA